MPLKNLIILLISIVVVVIGGFLITRNSTDTVEPSPSANTTTPLVTASPSESVRPRIPVASATPDTDKDIPEESPTPVVEATPSESPTPEPIGSTLITFTNSGYEPTYIEVEAGTVVTFENDSTSSMWTASNNHPTHTLYPGSGISLCDTESDKIFDACGPVQPGESWSFQFDEIGTWRYHDHLSPGESGIILVN